MEEELLRLQKDALKDLADIAQVAEFEPFRVKYLGRKSEFTGLMRMLGQVAKEDRPRLGKLANEIKADLEEKFNVKKSSLEGESAGIKRAVEDLSLPGRTVPFGNLHP